MADEYTPTEAEARAYYVCARSPQVETTVSPASEFDRWLAEHDAKVRAQAIRDARAEFYRRYPDPPVLTGRRLPGELAGAKYATDVAMDVLTNYADDQETCR